MPVSQECPLRIKWPNRGGDQVPRRVLSYTIDTGYLTSTDAFELEVFETDPVRLEKLLWEPVELEVDGCQQLIGRIERVERGYAGQHTAKLSGRDYLAELVEGHVDPGVKLDKGKLLADGIKLICSPYGVTSVVASEDVKVRDLRSGYSVKTGKSAPQISSLKLEDLTPDAGQGCFDFANKIAAHHGLTIQPSDKRSELLLAAPNFDQTPSLTLWRADRQGNLAQGQLTEDGSRTPTFVLSAGEQGNPGKSAKPIAANFGLGTVQPFSQLSSAYAVTDRRLPGKSGAIEFAKLYRLFYWKDRDARNQAQLERGLARALADRLKELLVYHATLIGHKDAKTGAIPTVDTTIQVDDDWTGVHEQLWVARRTLRWKPGEDSADVECWKLGALQL
jgi:prophage tail gpP-like protein